MYVLPGTVLCIGMEYQRTNNLPLAEQFFLQACQICPTDPLVYNELGVLYYRTKVSGHAGSEDPCPAPSRKSTGLAVVATRSAGLPHPWGATS